VLPGSYLHASNHARTVGLREDSRLAIGGEAPTVVPGRQPEVILARSSSDAGAE
jgi:hypothetical protein